MSIDLSVYQKAIDNMYTKVLYPDDITKEESKKKSLLQILGFLVTDSLPTSYPNLIIASQYPMNNSVSGKPSLRNFYTNWSNIANVREFVQIFSDYIVSDNLANTDSSIEADNVTNYFLSVFFENRSYDIVTNTESENPPSFVPSNDSNYVSLLGNIYLFFNFTPDSSMGIGRLGGDYINGQCMNNFKSYLIQKGVETTKIEFPDYDNLGYDWDKDYTIINEKSNNKDLVDQYRNTVSVNDTLLEWCGCFTPPSSIMNKNLGNEAQGQDNISSSTICDPLCITQNAIKRYSSLTSLKNTNNLLQCSANICVMNNININYQNSSAPILFEQICNGCVNNPTKSCLCILDTTNMSYMNKITYQGQTLLDQGIFQQVCPDSVCYQVNNGILKEIECNTKLTGYTGQVSNYRESGMTEKQYYDKIDTKIYIFAFLIIGFFLLFDFNIFAIESEYNNKKKRIGIKK